MSAAVSLVHRTHWFEVCIRSRGVELSSTLGNLTLAKRMDGALVNFGRHLLSLSFLLSNVWIFFAWAHYIDGEEKLVTLTVFVITRFGISRFHLGFFSFYSGIPF